MPKNKTFTMDIEVRFRDLDSRQHVNNAVYFTYFENGRQGFYHEVLHKHSLSEMTFILARTECNFIRAITLSDPVRLALWIKRIGSKSVTYAYRLFDPGHPDTVYAEGASVQVCFDYGRNTSMPIPPDLREKFDRYLDRDISE